MTDIFKPYECKTDQLKMTLVSRIRFLALEVREVAAEFDNNSLAETAHDLYCVVNVLQNISEEVCSDQGKVFFTKDT
jgi:hypothetical protein